MATLKATTEAFDADLFETRLEALKDTQDGIQQMSSWCLQQRGHHKKIVACWLNVFKRVRVEHRLTLFYLANDVIQYSKRKRYEFVESWATALQKATTMVRDEKVKGKILRIFNIWEQREIYNEEYLSDLCGLLNISPPKKSHSSIESSDDFQNSTLINNVRECVKLSEMTDKSFKKLPKSPNCDIESIKQQLKDKSHSDDVEKEIERYISYIEAFNKNLQAEIKSRRSVLANLDTAIKFYANQRGEVKVVVSAYKNFGSRIKLVKKKLDEMTPNLPSPIPSPDINAPSPEPDADLQLPDEQSPITLNLFKNNINGYSSYLDGNLPFDINDFKRDDNATKVSSQPIEVIGSRSDDESFNSSGEYYKPESISAYPGGSNIEIPGLNTLPMAATVQSGYTSLARAAQQYSDVLQPPPNPPLFTGNNNHNHNHNHNNNNNNNIHHGNMSSSYSSLVSSAYSNDNNYGTNVNSNAYNNNSGGGGGGSQPLMPPPPMPPSVLSNTVGSVGSVGSTSVRSNEFNSSWNMNMSWSTPLTDAANATSSSYGQNTADTPVSPPHFEREPHSGNSAPIEYSEHDNSLVAAARDVDHRQLHLQAFNIGVKLGLSKDKTRQLDIDHRNLISLTGSPSSNDNEKKSWLSSANQFNLNASGDVDYRTLGKPIKTIETTTQLQNAETSSTSSSSEANATSTNSMTTTVADSSKKSISPPQKSNASSSSESQKDETASASGGGTGYDPTDMVVDMDMSDEDLEDILREVNEQSTVEQAAENTQTQTQTSATSDDTKEKQQQQQQQEQPQSSAVGSTESVDGQQIRPPLLETPPEYATQNTWDTTAMSPMNIGPPGGYVDNNGVEQQQQQDWNQMPMPWGNDGALGRGGSIVPPPPRPPFPLQFPFVAGGGANDGAYMGGPIGGRGGGGGGRGGGRGWANPAQSQFRNFPRLRGGGGGMYGAGNMVGSPYFSRGGRGLGGGGMRGAFRGKFRGKNNWI